MKKFILGLTLGFILTTGISYAYRIPKPQRITAFDQNGLVALNESLENLWDITNGRYSLNTITTNPDGNLSGKGGDIVLFNSSGTYYLCINTTGAKIWRAIQLTDTP